ncbi:MAG: lycopene cyclase [Thermonema sp.]|uniref:lycopene cyclase family protein n=1 Tax=Thermonema sp. TaxID=2231181 RepID=UPI0021DE8A17|nr:lycopene cyclase family protein [Thermonema sp.]GIV39230.1 MAG: lycopene cyclase [Thermonema sp.]
MAKSYDYIIIGAGAAGLSLAYELSRHPALCQKRVLLIDNQKKEQNDRTWCFWTTGTPPFQEIVYRQWQQLAFHSQYGSRSFSIAPFRYYMIRGIDFYRYCFEHLAPAVEFCVGEVAEATPAGEVRLSDGRRFQAQWIFDSRYRLPQKPAELPYPFLLQHFKGYVLRSKRPCFDASTATLMDFRIEQAGESRFMYILPFSPTEALVEFTVFGKALLPPAAYDHQLKQYIEQHYGELPGFEIKEEEFGVIPMAAQGFRHTKGALVPIGTAAGCAKGSSGYAFLFIQKHCKQIIAALARGQTPPDYRPPWRFHRYDRIFLDVLFHKRMEGDALFSKLFLQLPPQQILRFLIEESSLMDELSVIYALRSGAFVRAALHDALP